MAFFLGKDSTHSKEIFKKVKNSYGLRSKIAHGVRITKLQLETKMQHVLDLEDWVTCAFIRIINEPDLEKIFMENEAREQYLDELPYELWCKLSS
jgi:hypothetical protein